jgi:hypothetical protein
MAQAATPPPRNRTTVTTTATNRLRGRDPLDQVTPLEMGDAAPIWLPQPVQNELPRSPGVPQ